MSRPRLLIVDPAMRAPEDAGVALLASAFAGDVTVLRPCLGGDGPGPETPRGWSGVVVMGSAASVYDPWPWVAELRAWLRPILLGEDPTPLFGICFGHQLVAHEALGGTADGVGFVREDHEKLVGFATSHVTGSRIAPGDRLVRTLVSHREEVKKLPPRYRVVGHRDGVLFDALEHEELPILTVQFHPEGREGFAAERGFDPAEVDGPLRESTLGLIRGFMGLVESQAGRIA